MSEQPSRRRVIRGLGALAAGGTASLAGCASRSTSQATTGTTTTTTTSQATTGTATTTGTTTTTSGATRTVTDLAGRHVDVPVSVRRVVGLGPGSLRLLTYADGVDTVVGVEHLETTDSNRPLRPYVLAHPSLSKRPSVGSRKNPDLERVIARDPDVVFVSYTSASDADKLQTQLGVPVVALKPGGLTASFRSAFFDSLDLVGTVFGTTDATNALKGYVKRTLSDLRKRADSVSSPPSGYVGYLGRGKHGFTFTEPAYVPLTLGGVDNVAADAISGGSGGGGGGGGGNGGGGGGNGGGGGGDGSGGGGGDGSGGGSGGSGHKGPSRVTVDSENVIQWDPSYVFVDLGTGSYDALGDQKYQNITAIANDDVYATLPTRDYGTNFGTVLADAYAVGAAANPDAYPADPTTKADEIYSHFVGTGVYDGIRKAYGRGFGRIAVH